jgi:protein-arginine kinase activator protein McsA
MAKKKTGNTADFRHCSNCNEPAPIHQMLQISAHNRTVGLICPTCQQAKKIQVTLVRDTQGDWEYFQYFPVEA